MKPRLPLLLLAGLTLCASNAQAAPAWRVQQSCALKRYLGATPAFADAWGRDTAQVSFGGHAARLPLRREPDRLSYVAAMASGRAFADRAADLLARRKHITREDALRLIGSDPGPWPEVTQARCDVLEQASLR